MPSPILSPPPSAIYWQPSLRTFLWTRVPLRGRQKLLLQLIFLIYFSFFRAWNSPTLLGRILQSQTRTSVQHVLIILLSVLHVVQISFLSVQSIFSFHQIIISSRSTYLFLYSIFFPSVKILFLIRSQCVSLCLQYSSRSLNLSSPFSLTFLFCLTRLLLYLYRYRANYRYPTDYFFHLNLQYWLSILYLLLFRLSIQSILYILYRFLSRLTIPSRLQISYWFFFRLTRLL